METNGFFSYCSFSPHPHFHKAEQRKAAEKAEKVAEKAEKAAQKAEKADNADKEKDRKRRGKRKAPADTSAENHVEPKDKKAAKAKKTDTEVVEPTGGSKGGKDVDKTPHEKPVENGVPLTYGRLQEMNMNLFKVELHGRKSFTVKAPGGCGASSIGCILTGHGSFYVYKAITSTEMAKLPDLGQVKAGSLCDLVCMNYPSLSFIV